MVEFTAHLLQANGKLFLGKVWL